MKYLKKVYYLCGEKPNHYEICKNSFHRKDR